MSPPIRRQETAEVLRALSRRCTGQSGECSRPRGGHHALCSGQIAKDAAIYPRGLCRAIIEGVALQMRADGIIKNGCLGMQAKDDDNEIAVNCQGPEQGYSGKYRDDLTGQVLKDSLVHCIKHLGPMLLDYLQNQFLLIAHYGF